MIYGTESLNSMKLSELFTILNTRILNLNHKATTTIISTNLSLDNLQLILEAGIQILIALIEGIAQSIPQLIPKIVEALITCVETIIDNIDLIIAAGVDILLALVEGIMNSLPMLISKIPEIITKLVMALTDPEMLVKLIQASLKLVVELAKGLVKAIPELVKAVPKMISELFTSFVNRIKETDWLQLGKDILKGILDGLLDFGTIVWDTIKKVGNKITDSIKDFFGIHSPSRLMRDKIGINLGLGIGEGFEKSIPETLKEVDRAMSELNTGIQASVNPIINPTANSNPLILNIDKFVNSRDTDVQSLMEEMEFYRKNTATAKGDV